MGNGRSAIVAMICVVVAGAQCSSARGLSGGAVAEVRTAPAGQTTGFFPPGTEWDRDVSAAAVDPQSPAIIRWLAAHGGWGTGRMEIDFSIQVLTAGAAAPLLDFRPTNDFFGPDCDHVAVPVPAGGALEGEDGYACNGNGDCHLIVVYTPTRRLYEMWRADIPAAMFKGGCLAVWDLTRRYGPVGRGDQCTSADAAGFPIAPLLFTADEVAAGAINHAIRFVLPNERIRRGVFVRPATHAGDPTGPETAVPYGARLRLRPDYPLGSLPNQGARVVARAMQQYGLLLADGGNIALTARNDRFTTAKWEGLLAARDLQALRVTDFEMIDAGPRIPHTNECARTP
jgi:serine/threonine-protein kinase